MVLEPGQKQQLSQATYEQYEIAAAGALIVVCAEPEKGERYYGLRGERLYTIQNCAAAIQNMLLEAHSLGLGSSWIGAFDEEAVKQICRIPENIRPQAIVAIGYPKEIPAKPAKFPMEVVTYFHHWRGKMRDSAKYMNDVAVILGRKREAAKEVLSGASDFFTGKIKEKAGSIIGKKEASHSESKSKPAEKSHHHFSDEEEH